MATAFADPAELVPLARAADRSGWHGVAVADHLLHPRDMRSAYPYAEGGEPWWPPDTSWPDPWVTIATLAAVTERLRFTTNVYAAPARDLFTVAKSVSTAAVLSGERVALGVGAGWCAEEFDQTGQDFSTRGKRLDEMIPALRELWRGDWASFQGDHYQVPEVIVSPVPEAPIPIYVGGESRAALRRAARLGDGWIGTLYRPEDAEAKVAELHGHLDEFGRDRDGFEVILSLLAPDDPDLYSHMEEFGVTGILHAPWLLVQEGEGESRLASRVEAVERFGAEVIAAA